MADVPTSLKLTGLYFLTADGRLAVVGDDNALAVDDELSRAFERHNHRFLADYSATPSAPLRVAVLYSAVEAKPWGSDTLALEESVVRELYPIGGATGAPLTAFQKKNREKSIYRGLELLLDCRKESEPRAPIYCPVLYDRRTTLAHYPGVLGRELNAGEAQVPVLDVLNLVATIPIGRRDVEAVHVLIHKVRARLIRKEMRRSFFQIDERAAAPANPSGPVDDAYQADRRAEREVALAASRASVAQMARWLTQPQGKADAVLLQSFTLLRDLPLPVREALAPQCLIYTAPTGAQLLLRETNDEWNMYLLDGTVALEAADGARFLIAGGSDKAAAPIAYLKPRKYTVSAVSPIRFLWIADSQLAQARAAARPSPR